MTNSNYSKLVERYFNGEMSSSEMTEFRQLIDQDPMLASEYGFQSEIIEGIKDFRKAELKMRLDNVDVTPGLFESLVGNTGIQAAAGVLLTGMVGFGAYLFLYDADKESSIDFSITSKSSSLNESEFNTPQIEELPLIKLKEFNTSNLTENINTVVEEKKEEAISSNNPQTILPNIVAPSLADSGDSEEILPQVEELTAVALNNEVKEEPVEVESITTNKQFFQYKFFNNKLYLYGDFRGIPYEILEINGRSGKKLFLYHNEVFYRINNNVNKTSRLRKVTDQKVIDELMILKENKTQ